MSQEEHFLFAAHGDTLPARLVGVCCDVQETETGPMGNVRRQLLARWDACGYEAKAGITVSSWSSSGVDQESFWQATRYALKRGGKTWLIAGQAVRVLGLLGAWERIERGQLQLVGHDPAVGKSVAASGQVPGMQGHNAGADADGRWDATHRVPGVRRDGSNRREQGAERAGASAKREGIAVIEDPPTILDLRFPGLPGTLHVVDLRNYGIKDYPHDLPCDRRASWIVFCMEEMCRILRTYGLGALQATAGGQAMHTLRRRFLTHSIWCHRDPGALELEAAALVGGRCECFRVGRIKGPVYHLDFRSLYPSICATANLPSRIVSDTQRAVVSNNQRNGWPYLALADVTLRTDEPAYPYRRGSHIVYPVGRFRTVLSGPELTDAHEHDRIEVTHSALMYQGAPALQAYAREMYALLDEYRNMGHPATVQWLKAMLVCLPGKFAQRDAKWIPAPEISPPAPWADWFRSHRKGELARFRSLGGNVEREEVSGFAFNACPAITGWVNSGGRVALLNAMRVATRGELYYCDTDSLLLSGDGFRRLESANMVGGGELGRLRLVARYSSAVIHGVKHYEVDGRMVCAGVPLDPKDIGPDSQHYWYNNWIKRQLAQQHRPTVDRILRRYARGATYAHGRIGDGGIVYPYVVGE